MNDPFSQEHEMEPLVEDMQYPLPAGSNANIHRRKDASSSHQVSIVCKFQLEPNLTVCIHIIQV